jgi:anti-sigma factor RsiW
MTACHDNELLLHGLLDGELDAANALSCEAHIRICPGCGTELERLRTIRAALATSGVAHVAPSGLRHRVLDSLQLAVPLELAPQGVDGEPGATIAASRSPSSAAAVRVPSKRFALSALGTSLSALAASVALALYMFLPRPSIQDEIISNHVRSLLAAHLTDVATSDRHVVKPWFNGKVDFAPPVVELADAGFPLVGGRLDYLHGQVAAALVYRRRQHIINLFVWPAATHELSAVTSTRHDGYTIARWTADGLELAAVSDVDSRELLAFRDAFRARAAPPT